MAPGSSKTAGPNLASFGRDAFVSARGLAAVLKKVRDEGLPEKSSRQAITRAKEQLASTDTPFGPLIFNVTVPAKAPAQWTHRR